MPELLIGGLLEGEDDRGAAYLLSGAALASADAAAGAADGRRARIDALLSSGGLTRFSRTYPELGVTRVRRVYLLELRSALAEVYRAAGADLQDGRAAQGRVRRRPRRPRHRAELGASGGTERRGPPRPPWMHPPAALGGPPGPRNRDRGRAGQEQPP